QGGTYGSPSGLKNNAWWQMAWFSNELVTPKILICPSDVGVGAARRMATDFSMTNSNGGVLRLGFRDRALSYVIALHSFYDAPRSILSGDRHFSKGGIDAGCGTGIGDSWWVAYPNSTARWTNAIHGEVGELLFTDGSVELLSTPGLQRALSVPNQG